MDQHGRGRQLSGGRLTLLLTSPRLAPGLLTRSAWEAVTAAQEVLARDLGDAQPQAGHGVCHGTTGAALNPPGGVHWGAQDAASCASAAEKHRRAQGRTTSVHSP